MLTVFQYGDIRRAHRDGSVREIARTFQRSRRNIRQILAEAEPQPYTRTKATPAPMLGAFHSVIETILADDQNAPPIIEEQPLIRPRAFVQPMASATLQFPTST